MFDTKGPELLPPAKIAFLGLGMMGLPMAAQLVRAGYDVRGYDPVDAGRAALAEIGGTPCASAIDAIEGAAALITMLPDGKAVETALVGGAAPPVGRLAPGAVVLDMSSSSPIGTRELAQRLESLGFGLVDAPVSGGVRRARDGSLAIMVGGPEALVARVRPLLGSMGKSIFATGPIGSGHAMKALNNYVSAAGLTAACEALRVGSAFGLDPEMMTDVLNASTGRNNSTEVKLKPFIISKTYGFSMALMAKDLRTADDLARHLDVPAPLSHAVTALWSEADSALGPGTDHTAIDCFRSTLFERAILSPG
jgi:3-hydroxyisobutyrate dehydrogenase